MNSAFLEYYRCPEEFATFALAGSLSAEAGYFRFGPDAICYGRSAIGCLGRHAAGDLYDVSKDVRIDGSAVELPFDSSEIISTLRREGYLLRSNSALAAALHHAYYTVRPILPVVARKHLQRLRLNGWKQIGFPQWPVDATPERIFERLLILSLKAHSAEAIPFIWFWPNGAPSCTVMTHDVEASGGRDFCSALMDLDDHFGIKASFQIVPEGRYPVTDRFLAAIRARGFEINVHDLNHDGKLFSDYERFLSRAERINQYGRQFGAAGFRSAVLYRNQEWYEALNFSYDMSVPSVGHLEAQQGGCCSVMPYFNGAILELPVTTTQDYSLFHILNEYSIDLWRQQIARIGEKHGLISFIVHPDYLLEPRARNTYEALLTYLARLRAERRTWIALPGEVAQWWRDRIRMSLTERHGRWEIDGPGRDRARIGYASLLGERLVYRVETGHHATAA